MKLDDATTDYLGDLAEYYAAIESAPRWKKAWWWLKRVPQRTWDWWRYTMPYGIRNLWRFRGLVWRWRAYDWTYTYEIATHCWGLQAEHFRKHRVCSTWEEDAEACEKAVRLYETFLREDDNARDLDGLNRANEAWGALHDHLKANARHWWD